MLLRNPAQDEPLFINLTPMIDVILTLLVFFITATRIDDFDSEEQRLDVSLPQVGYAQPLTGLPDDIRLTIHVDGAIRLNDQVLSLEETAEQLRAARGRYAGQGVVIRADGRALHQRVAEVLSACHAAGIAHIRYSVEATN